MSQATIVELWKRLHTFFSEHAPALQDYLNPPASEQEVQELLEYFELPTESELAAFYRCHNGEKIYRGGELRLGGDLFPVQTLLQEHSTLVAWAEQSFDEGNNSEFLISGPVRDQAFHPLWIPLCGSDGTYICLDYAPAGGGTRGQVISVEHECERTVLAPSLSSWFAHYIEGLEEDFREGRARYDEESESLEWE